MRDWIRKLREARGLKQAGFAKLAGLKPADFSRLECGYRDFKPGEAEHLAKLLGVTTEVMLRGPKNSAPVGPVPPAQPMPPPAPVVAVPPPRPPAPATPLPLGLGMAQSLALRSAPPVAAAPATPATPPPAPPAPVVYDLRNDPAHFRELPDPSVLEIGSLDELTYQGRLASALAHATEILHTSKVPADIWRAWREFEKKIHTLRRSG